MKLWFFLILLIFFILERSEHQTVSVFDAQRVFCLSCLSLDVICMDRDWIINAPKPTLSPYCNLCKSHHLSDEFSKCGTSPATNSSVAQLVISLTKIAILIWQLDFDLQCYGSSCSAAFISAVSINVPLRWSSNVFSFKWIHLISGTWCSRTCLCLGGPLLTVKPLIIPLAYT